MKLNTTTGKALCVENNGHLLVPLKSAWLITGKEYLPEGSSVVPDEGPFFCRYGEFLPSVINGEVLKDTESKSTGYYLRNSSIHTQVHETPLKMNLKQHEAMNISNAPTKVNNVAPATIP